MRLVSALLVTAAGAMLLAAAAGPAPADAPSGDIAFQHESVRTTATALLVLTLGGPTTALPTGGANAFTPEWSPDGRRLAYVTDRGGSFGIELMRADGSRRRRLAMPGGNREPAWSRTGRIAVVSDRDGNDEIYIVGARGGGALRLTRTPTPEMEPAWAPDARRLVFVGFGKGSQLGDLVLADAVARRVRQLVSPLGEDFSPSWSPDGRRIAFASTRTHWRHSDVYLLEVRSGALRRLTTDRANDYHPDWSPDGRWLVFVSDRDGNPELYVMRADGRGERRLTRSPGRDEEPSWRPAGARG